MAGRIEPRKSLSFQSATSAIACHSYGASCFDFEIQIVFRKPFTQYLSPKFWALLHV